MNLFDMDAEIRMLQTLAHKKIPTAVRFALMGKMDSDMFHSPVTQPTFHRMARMAKEKDELLEWLDVLSDPSINEEHREVLRESEYKPAHNRKAMDRLTNTLGEYRKVRHLYDMCQEVLQELDKDSIDADEVLDLASDHVSHARKDLNEEQQVWSTGKNSNLRQLVHDSLYKPGRTLYKTGFNKFDNINGGLPTSGVFIMAATTSGGKSVTSMNLLNQIHQLNKIDVMRFSLEMDEKQEAQRMEAMLSGAKLSQIKQQKLSEREKKNILKKMDEFIDFGEKNDCRYSFVTPSREMDIEDVLNYARLYDPRVLCIDYIGLLSGVDDDNQWRMLSAIARKCKVYGTENNCLVILLAQLDDKSSRLRYSQGMKEHADVCWFWNYADEEVRATKQLPIQVTKMRDGELMDLPLDEAFEFMRVTNPKDEGAGMSLGDDGDYDTAKPDLDDDDEDESDKKSRRRRRRKGSDSKGSRKSSRRSKENSDDDDDGGYALQ